ncbi:MAG: inorganic diphosphatase [Candidatus Iainarchaeum archaeon]|uniref:Inorganic pyrophosphatase n=1 Tax=Candidatus Iainarchaeum sp. TaxID=3101447 RepID=A0A497JFC4_9ARCH|nr:MAG: inorganic diphosphatase [Candidatus Diapherotrites archaeon]
MIEFKIGRKPPYEVNAVIEIPKHSNVKYEVHKKTGVISVSRFLYTATTYPYNYGFFPEPLEKDNDPIDVMVISEEAVLPGCVIEIRPIGMLVTEDENGIDNKIIAIPAEKIDPTYGKIKDIKDLDDHVLRRIAHFFETYKELEPKKWVKVKGFKSKKYALQRIKFCMKRYKQKEKRKRG